MSSVGKLNTTKLSIAKLKDICSGLDIVVDASIKRKQPYADKIEEYCQNVAAKRIRKAQIWHKDGVGRWEGDIHCDTLFSVTTQIPRQALTQTNVNRGSTVI